LPWRGGVSKHLKKKKEKSPILTSQASAILKDDWYNIDEQRVFGTVCSY
jgi:hypothetical protein